MAEQVFYENFGVPESGYHVADYMVPDLLKQIVIEKGRDAFSTAWAGAYLGIPEDSVETLLQEGFREGYINKAVEVDEHHHFTEKPGYWEFASFYRAVSVFAVLHYDEWVQVAGSDRNELLDWNLDEFCRFNHDAIAKGDRTDEVHTLQQAIDYVKNSDDNVEFSLQPCDCRSLFQRCDHDLDVCIHLGRKDNPNPNSTVERGYGRVIDKDEVIEVLKRSNKQGLMQTYNEKHAGAICNCCSCCCFEFQGGKRMPDVEYPKRVQIARFHENRCVNCGRCTTRCHFGAFEKVDGKIIFHPEKCYGCGVCAETCPKQCIDIVLL